MPNILNLMVIFIAFILIALAWHQLFKFTPEESMVMSAIFIMVAVFLLGAAGDVKKIYFVLPLAAIVALGAFVTDFPAVKCSKKPLYTRIMTFINPSVIMIAVLFFYSVIAFRGAIFTYPDEVYQWGTTVKFMSETGRLPYGNGFSGQAITLSMASMFQYVWGGLVSFVERNYFIGNFLLAFIPVFLPFSGASWKEWKKICVYTLGIFLSINILTYVKYYNLLQDIVLPMWTGSIIAWLLWKDKGNQKRSWIFLFGALMSIGSMKSLVGPLFAAIIIIVVLIRHIIICPPQQIRDICNRKTFLLLLTSVFSAASLSLIWSVLINENVYHRSAPYNPQNKNIVQIAKGVINRIFTVASGGTQEFPNMSYFILFMLVAIMIIVLKKKVVLEERKIFVIVFSLYAIGFILYSFVMLYAYANVFEASDSAIVAGLERYFSYYMLLGTVPLFSMLFIDNKLESVQSARLIRTIILILLVYGVRGSFISKISTLNQSSDTAYQNRREAKRQKDAITALAGEKGQIFILGTLSFDQSKILSFELEERFRWSQDCYKMYHRGQQDMKTYCDVVKYPELLEILEYDYLWCYNIEDTVEEYLNIMYQYGLTEMQNGTLYKIDRTGDDIEFLYLGNTIQLSEDKDSD